MKENPMNADEALRAYVARTEISEAEKPDDEGVMTICTLLLHNGMVVTGESHATLADYDKEAAADAAYLAALPHLAELVAAGVAAPVAAPDRRKE